MLGLWLSDPLVSAARPFVWRADLKRDRCFFIRMSECEHETAFKFRNSKLSRRGRQNFIFYIKFSIYVLNPK